MIAPAPRKPIPVTIWAAIRVGSKTIPDGVENVQSVHAYAETSVKTHAPSETSRCVRKPASWSRNSRSRPIAPPSTAASSSRRRASVVERSGTVGRDRVLLRDRDLLDAARREIEQVVEQVPRERVALGGRLHLDEAAVGGHHDVHVGLGG